MKPFEKAEWIYHLTGPTVSADAKYGNPLPYFRKEFKVKKGLKKATLSASAAGLFKAYINGKEFGDYMSPGWTDYRRRIPLMRFDATNMLEADNAIVLVVGDGWFTGNLIWSTMRNSYGAWSEVVAELKLEYKDGTVEYVSTGADWRAADGPIRRADNYMGEVVDRHCDRGDIWHAGYDDTDWSRPKIGDGMRTAFLTEESAIPTRVMHVVKPVNVYTVNDKTIYDFGQNLVGVVRFTAKSDGYAKIIVRHGEMTYDDGNVYNENYRNAEATDTLVLKGGETVSFRPLFTFHGFRYAEIHIPSGRADIADMQAEVMYSDMKETGAFTCSDELVSRLYRNIVWGQRGNFLNVPTDCPQRDERLGWTGDAQVFCGTAMFNMDCRAFYKKYMYDLADAQTAAGAVPGFAPVVPHEYANRIDTGLYAAGWGDVMTILPYEYYLMYGDKETVREFIPNIRRYVKWLENISDDYILPAEPNYGDWLCVNAETDKSLIFTAFAANSARIAERLCAALGEDGAYFGTLFGKFRTAFRRRFIMPDGKLLSHSQTAYLLAYSFGLMDADEVHAHLVDCVHAVDDHIGVGFLGVKLILPALSELGESALAYKLLTNRTYPGWLYSVVNGATTIWERWNGYTKEGGFGDVNMNSYNHYAYGSCGEWMFRYCLGIRPSFEGAGFAKLTLKPDIDFSGRLTHAEGRYDSVRGEIAVSWKVSGDTAVYTARVPEGIELTVDVPANVKAEIERY